MVMTRREFLGCAAGAMSVALPIAGSPSDDQSRVTVLDLKEHCALRESLAGYERAAAGTAVPRQPVLIVAAALGLPVTATDAIAQCLRRGGTVLIESGAGFAGEAGFRVHRDALRDAVRLNIEAVRCKAPGVRYVDYLWPYPTKIRDFSRVVPIGDPRGEIIVRVDGLPVGLKRKVGLGTLIFLGSPLGPALWAGDSEARQWLSRLLSL